MATFRPRLEERLRAWTTTDNAREMRFCVVGAGCVLGDYPRHRLVLLMRPRPLGCDHVFASSVSGSAITSLRATASASDRNVRRS